MSEANSTPPVEIDWRPLWRWSPQYAIRSLACLLLLWLIAWGLRDPVIRPTVGDALVVIWLYTTLAAVLALSPKRLALIAVTVAYLVELGQWYQLATLLNLGSAWSWVIGTTFDWLDIVAYSIGGVIAWQQDAR